MVNPSSLNAAPLLTHDNEDSMLLFEDIEQAAQRFPKVLRRDPAGTREITVWYSDDCLAMAHHPVVLAAMRDTLCGRLPYACHGQLETEVARLHEKEAGLFFASRSSANDAALSVLSRLLPDTVFLAEEHSDDSISHGIRHSGAERLVFHRDRLSHLDSTLAGIRQGRAKVVVVEPISAWGGNIAPLTEICRIAKRHDAHIYVDESRAVGMFGVEGGGIAAGLGLNEQVDIVVGSLEYGFGAVGSYIAGRKALVEAVRAFACPIIFTTSIPPAVVAGTLASVRHLRSSDIERRLLAERTAYLRLLLRQAALPITGTDNHMVSVVVGDRERCRLVADELLDRYAIAVRPVSEKVQVTPTPRHSQAEVEHLVDVLDKVWGRHGLPRTTS